MFIGDVQARTLAEAARYRQLTYTCLDTFTVRSPELIAFPNRKTDNATTSVLDGAYVYLLPKRGGQTTQHISAREAVDVALSGHGSSADLKRAAGNLREARDHVQRRGFP